MKRQKFNTLILAGALLIGSVSIALASPEANLKAIPISAPIAAPIEETSNISTRFVDAQGHWAIKDIMAMDEKGILKGVSEKNFEPNKLTTRMDFAVTLDRLFDFNTDDESNSETPSVSEMFDDVDDHQWYSNALLSVSSSGVLEINGRNFYPEKTITRMEVAQAIEKSFATKKLAVIMTLMFPVYEDTVNIAPDETSALSFVFNTGIMKGRTDKEFAPSEPVTRAELAVIFSRTLAVLAVAEPMDN